MSKTIAVWGSPGAGKSVFCTTLAKLLTQDKHRKTVIISGDQTTPMLPVWLPGQITEVSSSVGNVLTSLEIESAMVASHVVVLKEYPFIGVMGYAARENPLSYPEIRYEKYRELFACATRLVDYVILDCTSSLTCLFTPAAIEQADVVICLLTPDLKGIHYLQAQQALLVDPKFKYGTHKMVAGMARPYHAMDEMSHIVGGFIGMFPYAKEIDRAVTEGGMFQTLDYCGKKHLATLHAVLDALGENIVEQNSVRKVKRRIAYRKPSLKKANKSSEKNVSLEQESEEDLEEEEDEEGAQ